MAWFSRGLDLGNLDLAGAVNKLSESVKNIEKNFDTALGLEETSGSTSTNEASGLWPSTTDRKALFDPVMSFMGQKSEETAEESIEKVESSKPTLPAGEVVEDSAESTTQRDVVPKESKEENKDVNEGTKTAEESIEEAQNVDEKSNQMISAEEENKEARADDVKLDSAVETKVEREEQRSVFGTDERKAEINSLAEASKVNIEHDQETSPEILQKNVPEEESSENLQLVSSQSSIALSQTEVGILLLADSQENTDNDREQKKEVTEESLPIQSQYASSDPADRQQKKELTEESLPIQSQYASSDPADRQQKKEVTEESPPVESQDASSDRADSARPSVSDSVTASEGGSFEEHSNRSFLGDQHSDEGLKRVSDSVMPENEPVSRPVEVTQRGNDHETDVKERLSSGSNSSDVTDSVVELEKLKKEMKMMETALQGAARQAQAKADEIAKLMNENEQLKAVTEDLRRKSNDAEVESLREEYHQKVSALERKVYALTKERDTLRREQNKKSDAAALLKEKDEIINQVMAEGEQLSKKQAAQEAQMRKLRAQIRELEEEKKGLHTRLEVEENKVESIKRDKAATEKLLHETVEKHQAELATQKEYYTNALNAAREAEALAEARANNEARTQLEGRLREAEDREAMLVQALEELRQTLSRTEQQAVFKEDMLRRDIEDLQKRYQASERRCEELITQVPESTRPLLRQIEAMQETNARKAEAWAAVERTLNSRLQEAEAKAATSEEKERSINERLSQTLSRINVLEAQISCLRAEQTQLTRSLDKERQRAGENRQEYLALKEEAETNEGRVNQLEEEIKELRRKHKQELQEALTHQELLRQELEREKAARLDQERAARTTNFVPDQSPITRQKSGIENAAGSLTRRLSSASSLSSMEESYFLQASLDSSDNLSERRNAFDGNMSPYFMKSMTPALRQKEGELASYMSRLASMEAIRDSLAEELVKMTAECEKLRSEASMLPGIRAELDALRRRHSAALELMGERDEELEELRADIIDMKEMYREQVNMLVNKIQVLSSSLSAT
ncbi:golgin candidate 5 isoform X1 [Lycium ferocissimum]|uniref:golgin candidate 5 isoform X1 n=1 Tax=Lycium ferocissimum TaxID=112874 RepID=UPI002815E77F|nr:golgin candidate 5 isoform X1 [Lycium ferocissimum]XP_059290781.1 golgin candidate 5 isoform X1 [Lycium ferocissimum]